jgi:hypothetical protein
VGPAAGAVTHQQSQALSFHQQYRGHLGAAAAAVLVAEPVYAAAIARPVYACKLEKGTSLLWMNSPLPTASWFVMM